MSSAKVRLVLGDMDELTEAPVHTSEPATPQSQKRPAKSRPLKRGRGFPATEPKPHRPFRTTEPSASAYTPQAHLQYPTRQGQQAAAWPHPSSTGQTPVKTYTLASSPSATARGTASTPGASALAHQIYPNHHPQLVQHHTPPSPPPRNLDIYNSSTGVPSLYPTKGFIHYFSHYDVWPPEPTLVERVQLCGLETLDMYVPTPDDFKKIRNVLFKLSDMIKLKPGTTTTLVRAKMWELYHNWAERPQQFQFLMQVADTSPAAFSKYPKRFVRALLNPTPVYY